MMAGYLTAVRDNRGIAKAFGAIVAIFDDETYKRILNRKSSDWKGYSKSCYAYPQPCSTPAHQGHLE